jgi:putative phage-type endonuclease
MRIHNIAQHLESGEANPDWLALRAGKFSGSDFNQYMAIVEKGKLSDTAETALHKKVLSGIGEVFDSYKSESMERGNELEPLARQAYMCETFADVQEVGFVDWERLRAGCSPDGVIYGADGQIEKIIEIKCPEIVNYLRYAESASKIPALYKTQMQYNMLITGAKSCDFVAYYPGMRLIIHTIDADAELQSNIVTALEKLNTHYDEILVQINRLKIGE